jgi:hypothetical protein
MKGLCMWIVRGRQEIHSRISEEELLGETFIWKSEKELGE